MINGDLLKLFLLVKEKGGFELVSKNGLWGLVAEQCGLWPGLRSESRLSAAASRLKSVYVEYLDVLEKWLSEAVKEKNRGFCSGLTMQIEAELKGLLSHELSDEEEVVVDVERKDGKSLQADVVMKLDDGDEYGDIHYDRRSEVGKNSVGPCWKKARTEMTVVDVNCQVKEKSSPEVAECMMNSSDISIPYSKDGIRLQEGTSISQEGIVCSKYKSKCEEVESKERKKSDDNDDDGLAALERVEAIETISPKRKQDSVWTMLHWITGIAKNPCDPEVGSLPERPKWKSFGNEHWKRVLLAREAMFSKQHMDPGSDQLSWQRNQRMHPSMYDNHSSGYKERLRCRKSLLSRKKAYAEGASSKSSSSTQNDLNRSAENKKYLDKELSGRSELSTPESILDDHPREQVRLGPAHQAVVPEWTGLVSESELKWLGTRVWPPENIKHKHVIERDLEGNGWQNVCNCQVPGSDECFRFHIAHNRLKLKLELGSAFYHWKFDKMGEEVGLSWTEAEKKKFKILIESNPLSLDNSCWCELLKAFPTKCREELVNYYFNFFVLKRRGCQNRVTPGNINSDDENESVWVVQ